MNSSSAAFWDQRYEAEKMPWDLQGVPAAVTHFLKTARKPGRVLVPGCGSGYEIAAFLEAGWDVWGLDFSKAAVQRAKNLLGKDGNRVLWGDFFKYSFHEKFDLIYERAFLCALQPALRRAYAARIKKLLLPQGNLLGFFFYRPGAELLSFENENPPHSLSPQEATELFSDFQLLEDKPMDSSFPFSEGSERWQQWKK